MEAIVKRIWELGFEAGETDQRLFRAQEALETLKQARKEALRRVDEEYAVLLGEAQRKVDRLTEALSNRKIDLELFKDAAFNEREPGSVFDVLHRIKNGTPVDAVLATYGGKKDNGLEERVTVSVGWLGLNRLIKKAEET